MEEVREATSALLSQISTPSWFSTFFHGLLYWSGFLDEEKKTNYGYASSYEWDGQKQREATSETSPHNVLDTDFKRACSAADGSRFVFSTKFGYFWGDLKRKGGFRKTYATKSISWREHPTAGGFYREIHEGRQATPRTLSIKLQIKCDTLQDIEPSDTESLLEIFSYTEKWQYTGHLCMCTAKGPTLSVWS